jgi:hypothetical protein
MPETGTAFLVDPMGHAPVALDEDDYKNIRQYLHVKHSANDKTAEAIDWLLHLSIEHDGNKHNSMDDHEILTWMVRHYMSDSERHADRGVLAGRMKDSRPHVLSDRELTILEHTLTAIRSDNWFGDWLALQVDAIATASHPEDRYPSPLKIAATLVDCIGEYEAKMEAAREMVRMHPNLLSPPAALPVTPESPAASETNPTRPATKPAKAQRTRKPQKKVKRAA